MVEMPPLGFRSIPNHYPLMIDTRYYKQRAQLLSPSIIREIASTGTSDLLKSVLEHSGDERRVGDTLAELFEGIYAFLRRYYRSEHNYKNALANKTLKTLLARHSLTTSTLLTEFSTGESKADLVIINGSSSVYEVKTELDSVRHVAVPLGLAILVKSCYKSWFVTSAYFHHGVKAEHWLAG